jgi:hypothetical protein
VSGGTFKRPVTLSVAGSLLGGGLLAFLQKAVAQRAAAHRAPVYIGSGKRKTVGAHYHKTGKTYQPNGARERARRDRQIQLGALRYENGLRTDELAVSIEIALTDAEARRIFEEGQRSAIRALEQGAA